MITVFNRFNELFTERSKKIAPLNMGEDSVRYDFFVAISDVLKLNPWDINIEHPMHESSFIPRKHPGSKRLEKPQIDLYINNSRFHLAVEFGLFRQNSNENGTINKTKRISKMVGDIMRLGLNSLFTNSESYFVCVSDDKIHGHQLRCKVFDPFPADSYVVTPGSVKDLFKSVTPLIDDRFIKQFYQKNISLKANKVFDKPVISPNNRFNTRTIIWKITQE